MNDTWIYPAILATLAALGTALQRYLAYLDRRDKRRLQVDLERARHEHGHEESSATEPEPSGSPSSGSSGPSLPSV